MYCELHCHTYYSLLDGASPPETLLDRAVALGMPALAITDHDGLYGVVPFWQAARARDIHPIIGAELTLAHGSHLTLLAETQAGYANLSRLITLGRRNADHAAEGKRPLHLTIEDVAHHASGLLCLSGCRTGAVVRAILADRPALAHRAAASLAEIFGPDRCWIELQRHWLPDDRRLDAGLLAVAKAVGLGVVATNNVHYAVPTGHRLHDILTATRHNMSLAALGARQRPNTEFYIKGETEMAALFSDCPEALNASQAIADRCRVSLDFSQHRLPAFPRRSPDFPRGIPPGETVLSTLAARCEAALRVRFCPVPARAMRQLAHELAVIEQVGLADYFLIVWDIVRYAREHGIRCQGRGSAASSLVAYLLGITPVDPLRHDLLFERFLSERTDTMPDIDIDFAADRRDEVIAYIYDRYGADHAAMVCNVVTYRWRSAVRDIARALGFPAEELGRISQWAARQGSDIQPDSDLQLLIELVPQLIDTPRHLSVHAGGMLITAQPLADIVPLEPATKPGVVVAQWNKDMVEDAGLIKIDLLSLRTLGMLTETCQLIQMRHGVAVDLEGLPLDDPAAYQLLATGDTIGCFQVESRAQAQMLPRLKPRCFDDLIVQVSIVRPGPIQGGMVHSYLRRRQGAWNR